MFVINFVVSTRPLRPPQPELCRQLLQSLELDRIMIKVVPSGRIQPVMSALSDYSVGKFTDHGQQKQAKRLRSSRRDLFSFHLGPEGCPLYFCAIPDHIRSFGMLLGVA